MAISVRKFVESLSSHSILSAAELSTIRNKLAPDSLDADAEHLARELIKQGKLTKYQAMNIYQGRGKGLVFGEYIVLDKLGAGGMGHVFKAQHRRMKRIVALKVLPPHLTTSEKSVKRFYQEVQMAARLTHPNIVTAYDAGESHGLHYLVMEYVEGQDLSSLVNKQGPLNVQQALNCLLQTARGLEYAHGQGIIHRDIKPSNLLLDKQGTVKILDMGLARISNPSADESEGAGELTESGQVMGTADYMAPEQAADTRSADHRADIYSLGCTLYRLIAGKSPYQAETTIQKILAHRDQPIPSLRAANTEVSEALDGFYQRMMAKDPARRVPTMREVVEALERLHAGDDHEESSIMLCTEQVDSALGSFLTSQSAPGSSMIKRAAAAATSAVRKREEAADSTDNAGAPKWKSPPALIGGGAGLLAMVGLLVFLLTRGGQPPEPPPSTPPRVVETSPQPEPQPAPTEPATPAKPAQPPVTPVVAQNRDLPQVAPPSPGKPIDLLKLIDPKRDAVSGEWKLEAGALVKAGNEPAVVAIPCPLPAEYDVVMEVERLGGVHLLSLGMMVGPHRVRGLIDAGIDGRQTAISQIDGQAFPREATVGGVRLPPGSPHTVAWIVRRDAVRIGVDGNLIVAWQGDVKRLSSTGFRVPSDRLFIDATDSQFRITKLELRAPDDGQPLVKSDAPPVPPTMPKVEAPRELTAPFDLLQLVDVQQHGQQGTWQREAGALVLKDHNGPWPRIAVPYGPPAEYDLTVRVEFPGPGQRLGIGLVVDGKPVIVVFDRSGCRLSMVDGGHFYRHASVAGVGQIAVGEPAEVACSARKGRLFATFNGQLVLDWTGDASRFSVDPAASMTASQLCIVADHQVRVDKFEIAPPKAPPPRYTAWNLLPRIDPKRDGLKGEWRREGHDLVLASGSGGPYQAVLPLPGVRPREYVLTAVVQREENADYVALGLPSGGSRIRAALDHQSRTSSGLDRLKAPKRNKSEMSSLDEPCLLELDRQHAVVCRVVEGAIQVELNGREIIHWRGSPDAFAELREWELPDLEQLYVGAWHGPARYSKLTLMPADWQPLAEPPTDARAKVLEALKAAYAQAFAKTAPADVKRLAAEQCYTKGADAVDDPATQFVLWQEAARLASEAGDLVLALDAADSLAMTFAIDRESLEKQLVGEVFKAAKTAEQKKLVMDEALRRLERAANEENFDLALDLQAAVLAQARPVTSDLAKEMRVRGVELAFARSEHEAYLQARTVLSKSPDDPAAHLAAGRYLCLVVGDWRRGLAHLKRGSDLSFKALAALEEDDPAETEKQVALGDRWWELAEAEKAGPLKWAYAERAASWYRRAAPKAAGRDKTTIEQRRNALAVLHRSSNFAFAGRHPLDAVKIGDRWFKFYGDPQRWQEAASVCQRLGGSLPVIRSQAENDALAEYLIRQPRRKQKGQENVSCWIGCSDEETEGEFRWLDGSPLGYSKWASGEPNNSNGREDWVILEAVLSGDRVISSWKDVDSRYPFLCQWEY